MGKAHWAMAVLVDALGIAAFASTLISGAPMLVMVCGVGMILVFGALLTLLIRPGVLGARSTTAAKSLSFAIPVALFLGSLDYRFISSQEALAIAVGAGVGWLNWSAFRRANQGAKSPAI